MFPPYDFFYYDAPYSPNEPDMPTADALRQQMIDGIIDKNTGAVRTTLETAGLHGLDITPDAAMLFVAAKNNDRDTCRLLIAYGATWTPQQYALCSQSGAFGVSPQMLHEMRRFKPKFPVEVDKRTDIGMIHMLDRMNVMSSTSIWKGLLFAFAFEEKKTEDIRTWISFEPDHALDINDVINVFLLRFGDPKREKGDILDFLISEDIPIRKLKADDASWVEELHIRGLLAPDQSVARHKMIKELSDRSEKAKNNGSPFWIATAEKRQLAILCSPDYPVTMEEAQAFMKLDATRHKNPDFLGLLCDVGYFTGVAFENMRLSSLTPYFGSNTLKAKFNLQALYRRQQHDPAYRRDFALTRQTVRQIMEIEEKYNLQPYPVPPRGFYDKAVPASRAPKPAP